MCLNIFHSSFQNENGIKSFEQTTVLDCLMHHDHSCASNQFYNSYILCPILCVCSSEYMIPKHDLSRYFAGMGQCGEIQNLVQRCLVMELPKYAVIKSYSRR